MHHAFRLAVQGVAVALCVVTPITAYGVACPTEQSSVAYEQMLIVASRRSISASTAAMTLIRMRECWDWVDGGAKIGTLRTILPIIAAHPNVAVHALRRPSLMMQAWLSDDFRFREIHGKNFETLKKHHKLALLRLGSLKSGSGEDERLRVAIIAKLHCDSPTEID